MASKDELEDDLDDRRIDIKKIETVEEKTFVNIYFDGREAELIGAIPSRFEVKDFKGLLDEPAIARLQAAR